METDRTAAIITSCRADAEAQMDQLKKMIEVCDSRDVKAMLIVVLAAENTAKTVGQYCRVSMQGGPHGVARAAA